MRIAIASGKGGTGKTTLATNLASLLATRGAAVRLLDADVEEPDCHLFLHPELMRRDPVTVKVPVVRSEICTACGVCADVCAFHALTVVGHTVLVFPELCHSCGACSLLCPESAILENPRAVGTVERGRVTLSQGDRFSLVTGILTIGEAKPVPTARATLACADEPGADVVLIDAPPGTSCPAVEAVRGSDLVVLVTEPTPFGLNDLELAVAMMRALRLPFVVVINRADIGDDRVHRYCAENDITVVLELPDDRRIAEAYARGDQLIEVIDGLEDRLAGAWARIVDTIAERR